ncbi:MAG: Na/Pi cotransporter family protein [Proteobacteria bacterium]|nr:Na/Pi cotransporter family protein [Pseudomonadota bacterium]
MSAALILLTLAGNVALLLWGLHMVQSGLMRAFGSRLRGFLASAFGRRWKALLGGLGVTAVMQSSNATGMMAQGFVGAGLVGLTPALAAMLGANIGTTLIVQVLSFNVLIAAYPLLIAGVVGFKQSGASHIRDVGRAAIGLALILLALTSIGGSLAPIEQSRSFREVLPVLTRDPTLDLMMGGLLAWAAHSSVVVVLFIMSLAAAHTLEPAAALALVLGANLGTAFPQLVAASGNPASLRLAAGNLGFKCLGAVVALLLLPLLDHAMTALTGDAARRVALFHTLFNVTLAAVFFGFLSPIARLLQRLIPDRPQLRERGAPRYLATTPEAASVALSLAEREVLRIVDLVDAMLRALEQALAHDDRKPLAAIAELDDAIDRLHRSVKSYLTELSRREDLDELAMRRCRELFTFTVNLEHVGDIIDRNLRNLAGKKIKNHLRFSSEGLAEITEMHAHVVEQLRISASVLMTGDARLARALIDEKVTMRDLEEAASSGHLARLQAGRTESIETSTLHLDIIRDLKRITAHLASVAYPVLESTGELRRSRLSGA